MKILLAVTALIEGGTGVALLAAPSIVVKLLLGSPLDSAPAIALGRVAGAALFSLGIACWFASDEPQNRAARGLVAAMTFYNFTAVAVFLFAGLGAKLAGAALWPAIILHAAMAGWCLLYLWPKLPNEPIETR